MKTLIDIIVIWSIVAFPVSVAIGVAAGLGATEERD